MKLSEGNGSAIYEIGVADDGSFVGLSPQDMEVSLKTLRRMADFLKADVTILRKVSVESTQQHNDGEGGEGSETGSGSAPPGIIRRQLPAYSGTPRTAPEYLVVEAKVTSRLADEHHFVEIRVALVGGPDAGKSTLLGRLAHGIADNGRGKARLNLLRHRHEISSGRTSSISHEVMGFTATGETVNYNTTNISSWQEVCESSAKVVTLLDTCGHPRFLKTTISGLTGHSPDYACLVVDSRMGGVNEMTKEHLALAVALGLPTFVVVTKMDVATRDQLRATVTALMTLVRNTGPSCLPTVNDDTRDSPPQQSTHTAAPTPSSITVDGTPALQKFIPVVVHQEKDLAAAVKRFSDVAIIQETNTVAIPILLLSSVTGENINLLERFLFLLPKPSLDAHGGSYSQEPACYQIEEIYNIPDIGTVVGGFLHAGRIEVHKPQPKDQQSTGANDTNNRMRLYLGPVDRDGGFIPVTVKSIHRQRMSMRSIDSGHTATLAIEGAGLGGRVKVRRGMVVLESDTDPRGTCCRKFEAVIQVLSHDGVFGVGFQGMIHCGSVHQNAKVVRIELLQGPGQEGDDELSSPALPELDETPRTTSFSEPQMTSTVRPTSRDNNRDNRGSPRSSRSNSPSSDYGSGTGSSVAGSVSMSRSSSQPRDNIAFVGISSSTTDDQESQHRQRPRRIRRKDQESKANGMIPISTMRTFRRLSMKNSPPPTSTPSDIEPADSDSSQIDFPQEEQDEETAGESPELKTGSRARVVFRFCHDVAFMREGTTVLFRNGETKCVGKVLRML
ncbi:GTP binding protein [Mortierella sp. AD011]|nr:GTP binding protein [Mortierella sp. AD010]KAF9385439.1 GTP binding protein [Mortierella sp. AD011]